MAKYMARPVNVEAWKIERVRSPNADCTVDVLLEDKTVRVATIGMLARIVLRPGDYWVIHEDGYAYLNPRDVFERKYALAE